MCEQIKLLRIFVFFIVFAMALTAVFSGWRFCKKRNIDLNTFKGMFEMYSKVFKFEDKTFSILMLVCMYGGALLMMITIGISLWAESKGCVFPTQHNK